MLVNGAGGSIGTFAVQIAKTMDAEVTAVDSPHKENMLRAIGVDHFIDYTQSDFTKNGQIYDVIFNMVASASFSRCIASLSPMGRYVMGNPRMSDMLRSALVSRFSGRKAIFAFAGETKKELYTVKQMIEEGRIRSIVDRVFSIEQAAEAHRRVETEQRLGAVVLSLEHDLYSKGAGH